MNPWVFGKESYQELRKATWLTWEQAVGSTVVVLALVGFLAVFAGALDYVLAIVTRILLGGPAGV